MMPLYDAAVEPFFFGDPSRFGMYHATPAAPSPRAGVVILSPIGHEYIRAHRAIRNLAVALSRASIPVLRFDYLATGDSSGDTDDLRLPRLLEDADLAIAEMQRRSGVKRVSLVGLRLGAALAALASARRADIDTLVLWDPVIAGQRYLQELAALQVGWLRDRLGAGTESLAGDHELLGMTVPPEFVGELRGIDLAAGEDPNATSVSILVSSPRPDCVEWLRGLNSRGRPATYAHVPSAGGWTNPEAVHQLLLPHEMITRIVTLAQAS